MPDDYDVVRGLIRVHINTKTHNDIWLALVKPLEDLLANGWEPVNMRRAERAIRKALKGHQPVLAGLVRFSPTLGVEPVPPGR